MGQGGGGAIGGDVEAASCRGSKRAVSRETSVEGGQDEAGGLDTPSGGTLEGGVEGRIGGGAVGRG